MRVALPLLLAGFLALSVPLTAQEPAGLIAVRGGRVLVAPGQWIDGATVLVRKGRIAAVGTDVEIPEGARVIDATGKVVSACWIDGRSTGLLEPSMRSLSPAGPQDFAANALNAGDAREVSALLAAGIGSVYLGTPIGTGKAMTGALVVPDASAASGRVVEPMAAIEFQIGESRRSFGGRTRRFPFQFATAREEALGLAAGALSHDEEGEEHEDEDEHEGEHFEGDGHDHVLDGGCNCLQDAVVPPLLPGLWEPIPYSGSEVAVPLPEASQSSLLHSSSVTSRSSSRRTIETALKTARAYRKVWEKYEKDYEAYEKKLAEWKKSKGKKKPAKKKAEPKPEKKEPKKAPVRRGPPKLPDGFRDWPREKQREWFRSMRDRMRRRSSAPAEAKAAAPKPKKDGRPTPPPRPMKDPGQEAVLRVIDGEIPLRVECWWKQDIRLALDLARKEKLALVLVGAGEAHDLLDEIAEAGARVVLAAPRSFGANRIDPLHMRPDLARLLDEAGIPFGFMTAGVTGFGSADLELIACLAMAEGLSEEGALRALTSGAAATLGMESELGTLERGRRARLQILSGSPLDPDTRVERLVLGGEIVTP